MNSTAHTHTHNYIVIKSRKADIKVAQLVGYVSEQSAYHHGEASLENTIIGLAQDSDT